MSALDAITEYLRNYDVPIKIMEVCGTHTAAIHKSGIRSLLSPAIRLVSGPGCPVCVTEASVFDALCELALRESTAVVTFGDMLRVRGRRASLAEAKASGGDVRMVYSPFDAVHMALNEPHTQFVFAAVGFETTAPLYAALLDIIIEKNITNLRLLTSLKTMPEALGFICRSEAVDGFICPGHVSVITGSNIYEPLCREFRKPFVVAGFEAEHILAAICEICRQNERGDAKVTNLYPNLVTERGQAAAQALIGKYFAKANACWRGIGLIKNSGYELREEYARFSAEVDITRTGEAASGLENKCRCADVLLGRIPPAQCPLFGRECTPRSPVGPCMVSSEGSCGIAMEASL